MVKSCFSKIKQKHPTSWFKCRMLSQNPLAKRNLEKPPIKFPFIPLNNRYQRIIKYRKGIK